MPPTPPPTAEQAITQTLYATINHNLPVMVYVSGALLVVGLLLVKPNRKLILFLLGFVLLAFHFEYVKHIAEPLLQQTQTSIESTGYQSVKGKRLVDIFFQDLVPFGSYVVGWGLIFLGIILNTIQMSNLKIRRADKLTHEVKKHEID